MRYDYDGVRVGVLDRKSQLHLRGSQHRRGRMNLTSTGSDRKAKDEDAGVRTTGERGSLKVLLFVYFRDLVWFFTKLEQFLLLFVIQLLYDR